MEQLKALPYAFTEHGAAMLASVLNSDRAILVNIQIVRVLHQFVKNRWDSELHFEVENIKNKVEKQVIRLNWFLVILNELLEKTNKQDVPGKRMGFKPDAEEGHKA